MTGHWYIQAFAVLVGLAVAISEYYVIAIAFLLWLIYLYAFSHVKHIVILLAIGLFFCSFYYYVTDGEVNINDSLLRESEFIGEVKSPLHIADHKYEFTIQEKQAKIAILVKLFNNEDRNYNLNDVKFGAICTIHGLLTIPTKATNPGQFDYQQYLLNKKVKYELIITSENDLICNGEKKLHHFHQFRQSMIQIINKKLSPETAQWMNALVFGNRSFIEQETIQLFQQWGLSHILAISGLHTGIVIGIVYFLLVKLLVTTREKAQLMMIGFLPLFALVTGGEPSVWRASLMVLLFIILSRFKREHSLLDILSIVFILLISFDKQIIYHIGFQFSFLVTFGLLLSLSLLKRSKSRLYQAFLISFVAQMIILPVQLHYFYTFQPLSILLNLVVIPYFTLFVIPFMFLFLVLMLLPHQLLHVFDHLFVMIHDYFLMFLNVLNDQFNYQLLIGNIPSIYFFIYYVLFYFMMQSLEQKKLRHSFLFSLCLIISLYSLLLRPYFSPIGTVTMLDIGQGDAFIIELPYRKGVFMIDAGSTVSYPDFEPNDYVYKSIIKQYLNKQSIYKLDGLFLSHEHVDHYGSVLFLLEDKVVDEIFVSPYFIWENELHKTVQKHQVKKTTLNTNEKLVLKGHPFYVLAPRDDFQSANDNSLVLYTRFGTKSWLFTGDMEKQAELSFIKSIDHLHVDILKVGHHGSKTSTNEQFIEKIRPQYALIPVGKNNRYNHPADEVIDLLNERNITIFRTDEDGAVQYFYKGLQTQFKTFNEK